MTGPAPARGPEVEGDDRMTQTATPSAAVAVAANGDGDAAHSLPARHDIRDDRFAALVHPMARLDRIATGFTWTEGPVWFGDHGCLLFSDIPSDRVMRWSEAGGTTVHRAPAGFANGHTRDAAGRLVECRHGTRDLVRVEPSGRIVVLADRFEGRRLNSPNDVIVARDGTVWFTDPTYGILSNFEGHRADPDQPVRGVYRIPPGGMPELAIDDFVQPNGLCLSPDEGRLYVAESGRSHDPDVPAVIRAFDLSAGVPRDAGIAATVDRGVPDGIRCDTAGNLWSSAADGVHCFAPDGVLLGKIAVPEVVSNLCFGGPDGRRLFITATTSVYRTFVDARGAEDWTHGA